MPIVLPIVLFAVAVGLFVPQRYQRAAYWWMAFWIALVIARYWFKR